MSRFDAARSEAAAAVRLALRSHGMTQAELAVQSGVWSHTISNFIREKHWPHEKTLRGIEAALGWRSGYLDEIARGFVTTTTLTYQQAADEVRVQARERGDLDEWTVEALAKQLERIHNGWSRPCGDVTAITSDAAQGEVVSASNSEMIAVAWYEHTCEWVTKFCDEHHLRYAHVPADALKRYEPKPD
jgi:transcriptional regulator with XRE-family HTH domain